jgi:hypothetical protein
MSGYGNFTSPQNQTPAQKIEGGSLLSQLQGSSDLNAGMGAASKLMGTGMSVASISSVSSQGLDNVSGALKGDTTSLVQTALGRASPADLISKRTSDKGAKEKFAQAHMPQRKITNSRVTGPVNLTYPPDMRKYYINFALGEYVRPNPYEEKKAFKPDFHIALPMPSNLLDPNGVKLKPTELGGLLGAAAENIAGVVQNIASGGFTEKGKGVMEGLRKTANQSVGAAYNLAFETASMVPGLDDIAGVAGQLLGAVPNPHVTVFFQGVDLRAHSFTWRFAPKNVTESITVQTIIREFKKRMLPNYKWGAANVLGYPNMVQISLQPDMIQQLYQFKPCMISAVNVNYAPNGIPSFFAGTKYPTAIEFQVNFQELEIFTSQDYGGKNGDIAKDIGSAISNAAKNITGSPSAGTAKGVADIEYDQLGNAIR